ncbi:MAG: ankyrin repeat domain-containing protein [Rhodospirillaceae bacterium]|nr:ankyrin repeat domain-containing protein [Rhodospirillaceae bacterium]
MLKNIVITVLASMLITVPVLGGDSNSFKSLMDDAISIIPDGKSKESINRAGKTVNKVHSLTSKMLMLRNSTSDKKGAEKTKPSVAKSSVRSSDEEPLNEENANAEPAAAKRAADCSFWKNRVKIWGVGQRFFKYATVDDVQKCLKEGANPNALGGRKRNIPILVYGVATGQAEIVKMLLKAIDSADETDANAKVYGLAIKVAAEKGSVEIVKILLEAGADPNQKGVLEEAAKKGSVEIVQILLDAGENADTEPVSYEYALVQAVKSGRTRAEIVKILLDAGADPNIEPVLYLSLQGRLTKRRIQVIQMLLEGGADPNQLHEDRGRRRGVGNSPLGVAAKLGNTKLVQMLLDAGADPNLRHRSSHSPLVIAVDKGKTRTVKILLDAGADPNQKSGRYSPMAIAKRKRYSRIMKLLREAGGQ